MHWRSTCSIGWPNPRSIPSESAATSSARRTWPGAGLPAAFTERTLAVPDISGQGAARRPSLRSRPRRRTCPVDPQGSRRDPDPAWDSLHRTCRIAVSSDTPTPHPVDPVVGPTTEVRVTPRNAAAARGTPRSGCSARRTRRRAEYRPIVSSRGGGRAARTPPLRRRGGVRHAGADVPDAHAASGPRVRSQPGRGGRVVQDTWLGVARGIDRFEGRSSVATWLFTILVNRAKSTGHVSAALDGNRSRRELRGAGTFRCRRCLGARPGSLGRGGRRPPRGAEIGGTGARLPRRSPAGTARGRAPTRRGGLGRGRGLFGARDQRCQSACPAPSRAGPGALRPRRGDGAMMRWLRRRALVCRDAVALMSDYLDRRLPARGRQAAEAPPGRLPALPRVPRPAPRHHRGSGACSARRPEPRGPR